MPAAAVIPAPIAYIKVVAVKKLVVELLCVAFLAPVESVAYIRLRTLLVLHWSVWGSGSLL